MNLSRQIIGALVVLMIPVLSFGEAKIPDLRGTWTGDFSIIRSQYPEKLGPNPLAFTKPGFHRANGVTYVIERQDGALFAGTETFGQSKQTFVGAFHFDGKTLSMADQGGTFTGYLAGSDTIHLIYLENTTHGQVAARGTITRK
jgi:hypothetical protein